LSCELSSRIKSLGFIRNDRFSYLASYNLTKLHDFGHGNLKWGRVKSVIANSQFSVLTFSPLVNSEEKSKSTFILQSASAFSDKGVIYVVYGVNMLCKPVSLSLRDSKSMLVKPID
jgi:hypothetical protein